MTPYAYVDSYGRKSVYVVSNKIDLENKLVYSSNYIKPIINLKKEALNN